MKSVRKNLSCNYICRNSDQYTYACIRKRISHFLLFIRRTIAILVSTISLVTSVLSYFLIMRGHHVPLSFLDFFHVFLSKTNVKESSNIVLSLLRISFRNIARSANVSISFASKSGIIVLINVPFSQFAYY